MVNSETISFWLHTQQLRLEAATHQVRFMFGLKRCWGQSAALSLLSIDQRMEATGQQR